MLPGKEAAIFQSVVGKVCLVCWPLSEVLRRGREQATQEKSIPGPGSSKHKGLQAGVHLGHLGTKMTVRLKDEDTHKLWTLRQVNPQILSFLLGKTGIIGTSGICED